MHSLQCVFDDSIKQNGNNVCFSFGKIIIGQAIGQNSETMPNLHSSLLKKIHNYTIKMRLEILNPIAKC